MLLTVISITTGAAIINTMMLHQYPHTVHMPGGVEEPPTCDMP
jgi:hypothetical protein